MGPRLVTGECDCGEPATKWWDEGADFAFWTRQPRFTAVCAECWSDHDNYEPPEVDGEAFRGGERAAYVLESLARIQRELK